MSQISVYSRTKAADVMIIVSPEFEKVAKALAGGNVKSICRALFANPRLRQEAVSKVSSMVNKECSLLCKKKAQPVSLFRHMSLEQAESFSWNEIISELNFKAPTLFHIIHDSIVTCSDHRNKQKKGDSHYPSLCTAVAILLKERNRQMCGLQSYISSALFSTRIPRRIINSFIQ